MEKKPYNDDIVVADIAGAIKLAVVTTIVLRDVAIISPIFVYPISLPIKSESTVKEDIYPIPTLIELNAANDVVRFRIVKLLAYPAFVEIAAAEILEAVRRLVLTVFVLTKTGSEKEPPAPATLVKPDPSPTNLA